MAETKKPTNRERLQEITAGIEQGIKELFESDRYTAYLRTMSRFHHYSVNNQMLIHMQKPDATIVAGFNKWRDQFERHVRKGEKGIKIIAPTPFKKKFEEQKYDPDTMLPVLDKDGKAVMEEKEVEIPMFRPVTVFDVSQTEGKPLPHLAADLHGDVKQYEVFLEALRRAAPVPVDFRPMKPELDGYFDQDAQRIAIREGMSQVQTVSAAVHEITHAKLHNHEAARLEAAKGNETKKPPAPKDRATEEVEAESVSYAVCQYYGIQTGENSFGYIATWSKGKELPELRASLETINKTASGLITDIDRHFRDICKERGIDLTAPEQAVSEQAAPELPEVEYVYKLHANPRSVGENDAAFIQVYERRDGALYPGEVMRFGKYQDFIPLVNRLNNEQIKPEDAQPLVEEATAVVSQPEPPEPEPEQTEALYLLDDTAYLHLQATDGGWDYTLYDRSTARETDGGCLDAPDLSLDAARDEILASHALAPETVKPVTTKILGLLKFQQEVQEEQPHDYHRELVEHFAEEEAAEQPGYEQWSEPASPENAPDTPGIPSDDVGAYLPELALDEYPMPDPALTVDDLEKCGYLDGDMLPLSKDRALELYEQDLTIYTVAEGGEASMAFEREDIEAHGGLLAVPREEWEDSPPFADAVADRLNRQEQREAAFLQFPRDAFAIYQLKDSDEMQDIRFEGLDWLESKGRKVEWANYDLVYTAPLTEPGKTGAVLDGLWYRFNNEHPADYHRPSLSVSDIVAIKQDGVVTCHYCDSFGFAELPGFFSGKNMLRAAEDSVEQNDNQLDGIINNTPGPSVAELEAQVKAGRQISLTDLAAAVHRERQKKSVVERLKQQPPQRDRKKEAPKKSAEREL